MDSTATYREIYIKELKQHFGMDERRISHALKVLRAAEKIMDGEKVTNDLRRIITITAVLHDVGIKPAEEKYNSSAGTYQELEGPPVAREIMERCGEAPRVIERVAYIVGGHHTSSKNDGLDFQIIWEADWFVNIEEDGFFKNVTKAEEMIKRNFVTKSGKKLANEQYLVQT